MKTSELIGPALDWAVTSIEAPEALRFGVADWREQRRSAVKNGEYAHRYHQNWAQGGPIIEREEIAVCPGYQWEASMEIEIQGESDCVIGHGPTPLIAAMRCYVASKLGDEVEIPEELK